MGWVASFPTPGDPLCRVPRPLRHPLRGIVLRRALRSTCPAAKVFHRQMMHSQRQPQGRLCNGGVTRNTKHKNVWFPCGVGWGAHTHVRTYVPSLQRVVTANLMWWWWWWWSLGPRLLVPYLFQCNGASFQTLLFRTLRLVAFCRSACSKKHPAKISFFRTRASSVTLSGELSAGHILWRS